MLQCLQSMLTINRHNKYVFIAITFEVFLLQREWFLKIKSTETSLIGCSNEILFRDKMKFFRIAMSSRYSKWISFGLCVYGFNFILSSLRLWHCKNNSFCLEIKLKWKQLGYYVWFGCIYRFLYVNSFFGDIWSWECCSR